MPAPTVVEIPQWQGSASPEAPRLAEGARLLAGLFPGSRRLRANVDDAPGDTRDGVRHLDVLAANLAAAREATAAGGHPAVTIGGDCGIDLAPIEAALHRYGDRLAVVWFDAHGDLNTPQTSPSGAFHGMVLRTLLGEGPAGLTPARTLTPAQVTLAGVRSLDPGERDYVERHGLRHLTPEALADPSALVSSIDADAVHVHIDLDVLDPSTFTSIGYPEPGGLTPEALAAAVTALTARLPLAGLTVTEYQPNDPQDQETLSRLIAALAPF
ncbi:arginase family protein [Thermomonospora cellulosilytica]|uniref:Arginase n=1 Tax=Thermomonospora cellulosilytica TaxID=1411118 RepID=A0A7W3MSN5_9ACTN|nr:arginase family protein [Thermomonospora cellulosilytica]MBA9001148.1 arginase [Thermomonospora cellulosilytica]